MKTFVLFITVQFCVVVTAFGQGNLQYFLTLNGNYFLPIGSDKQVYPIMGYDKDADPKFLLGGLGLGASVVKEWKEKFLLKGQANISSHAYWDEPIYLTDANANPLGSFVCKSVDYVMGITATIQYRLSKRVAIGPGLGADFLLVSISNLSEPFTHPDHLRNGHYKRVTPVIPLELSFYLNKVLLNVRYEQGLVNRFRDPLSEYEKEMNSLLVFEIGFKLN